VRAGGGAPGGTPLRTPAGDGGLVTRDETIAGTPCSTGDLRNGRPCASVSVTAWRSSLRSSARRGVPLGHRTARGCRCARPLVPSHDRLDSGSSHAPASTLQRAQRLARRVVRPRPQPPTAACLVGGFIFASRGGSILPSVEALGH
jgi:hypothetical protein